MNLRLIYVSALSASTMLSLAACGDDPVSYSEPVGINLKAKSDDTINGVVTDEKGISTESGNPYGAFVSNARDALGGADPASIEVSSVTMFLGASSTGVATLGDVFDGNVEILFEMNDTNNSYPVAHVAMTSATPSGPIELAIDFDPAAVPDLDYAKFLGGSFKVISRGDASTGFETKGADADLQVTFTFAAFE